jgi:tetratricopeptide (TPR) repeat protein
MTANRAGRADTTEISRMLEQAERCFAGAQLAEAAALCDAIMARAPEEPRARRQRALVHVVQHEFLAARALLEPLAPRFAQDADFQLALAEAIWGSQHAAAALPHFEAAGALAPDRPRIRLRLGQALLAAGAAPAARAVLETVVAALPDSATALIQLGMAEAATGEPQRALARFEAARALDPQDPDAWFQLGQTLRAIGRADEAIAALREAVARAPDTALLRVALGDVLAARGQREAASVEFKEAVRLAPGWGLGWVALGRTVQQLHRLDEAIGYYRIALGLDRGMPELDAIIGNALLETGATAEARAHFVRSLEQRRWAPGAPASATSTSDGRLRVGVLLAPGANNTPTEFILDPAAQDTEIVFMLDGFDYPHARLAASYDLLFNAIGDPDRAADALACATAFVRAVPLPVVNPPALIAETGRDRMAARLAGLADCHVPATRRVATARLRQPGAGDRFAEEIGFPLLARPVGSHGGDDLVKLDTPAALAAHAAGTPADALYLTRFCDFRSADGLYRKYRFIFVAGEIFAYHLAIGDHWLVHYFRTEMGVRPALLDEEARFLSDYRTSLGPRIATALAAIVQRVPLDFFGIDGSVDQDGRLLVFECNATMLVHDADPGPVFDFKRAPAERIRRAVGRLLAGRGGRLAP